MSPDQDVRDHSHPTVATPVELPAATRLMVFHGGGPSTHVLPETGTVTIGRSKECDVRVDHPSLSRKHAELTVGPRLLLTDLGSINGTRVGGRALVPHAPTPLSSCAIAELGSVLFALHTGAPTTTDAEQEETPSAAPTPGVSRSTTAIHRLTELVAASSISVVLLGETGTGKTVLASTLHRRSRRVHGPFVALNCAALPEALLESELFGHERGAFTGATQAKAGLLEAADGGTLFLDEVGEMPLATQAKLLHVLESGQILRIGSLRPRSIDVRYVAATNRDLDEMVATGSFRRDLYFRLNGITIPIPPLRERMCEIAELARTFLAQAARATGVTPPALMPAAERHLASHGWPGNIRELKNVVERALILSRGGPIDVAHLPFDAARLPGSVAPPAPRPASSDLRSDLEALERQRILDALEAAQGNQTRAAAKLGVSRRTLINRLEQYALPRPRKPVPPAKSDRGS